MTTVLIFTDCLMNINHSLVYREKKIIGNELITNYVDTFICVQRNTGKRYESKLN